MASANKNAPRNGVSTDAEDDSFALVRDFRKIYRKNWRQITSISPGEFALRTYEHIFKRANVRKLPYDILDVNVVSKTFYGRLIKLQMFLVCVGTGLVLLLCSGVHILNVILEVRWHVLNGDRRYWSAFFIYSSWFCGAPVGFFLSAIDTQKLRKRNIYVCQLSAHPVA